jgi:hypothetical protein
MKITRSLMIVLCSVVLPGITQAAIITNGFTFAVASNSDQSVGNHFHSSTGGAFGNPAGIAEVGAFGAEMVKGLSEYNLVGLTTSTSAFVTFNVFGYGLFPPTNSFPFNGIIDILAYQGNNAENISDFQAPSIASVGSFQTSGLNIGNIFSFDITGIYNDAINNGWNSLGIRLQTNDALNGGAWSFNDFRLTTDNQSDGPTAIPEPGTLLAIGCLLGSGLMMRNRRKPLSPKI